MGRSKNTKGKKEDLKTTISSSFSTNALTPLWSFAFVDRNGPFRFDIERDDFDPQFVLQKFIDLGAMSWQSIVQTTHDKDNKSCHHFLDYDGMSPEAKERVRLMVSEQDYELVFSFRLDNFHRIIGIRRNEKFEVKWYDPRHEFYPSDK